MVGLYIEFNMASEDVWKAFKSFKAYHKFYVYDYNFRESVYVSKHIEMYNEKWSLTCKLK